MLVIDENSHLHPTVDPRLLVRIPVHLHKFRHVDIYEMTESGRSCLIMLENGMQHYLAKRGSRRTYSHMTNDGDYVWTNKLIVVQGYGRLITAFWGLSINPVEPTSFRTLTRALKYFDDKSCQNEFWRIHALKRENNDTIGCVVPLPTYRR